MKDSQFLFEIKQITPSCSLNAEKTVCHFQPKLVDYDFLHSR